MADGSGDNGKRPDQAETPPASAADEQAAMERAQAEAAEERKDERGYQ